MGARHQAELARATRSRRPLFARLGLAPSPWLALALALAGLAASCGPTQTGPRPEPLLSRSIAAQNELEKLVSQFSLAATPDERARLGPALASFVKRHASDDARHVATVLLSWIAMEAGDLERAEQLATLVEQRGPARAGFERDMATAVRGSIARRRGDPQTAFTLLEPLFGKLLDGYARALFNEEAVLAAVEAGLAKSAVRLMQAWLIQAGGDRVRVRERVAALLGRLAATELEPFLVRALERTEQDGDDMVRLLTRRLAEAAVASKNVPLARLLLAQAGVFLGDLGDSVAKLAGGASVPRADSRTVGILLAVSTDVGRERSLQVAAGLASGLGMPKGPARLVTADDAGSEAGIEAGLTALVRQGAVVIVAGLLADHATRAAVFARRTGVPVLLLRPPAASADGLGPNVLLLGDDPTAVAESLAEHTRAAGKKRAIAVVEPGLPVLTSVPLAVGCDALDAPIEKSTYDAVVVAAPSLCARSALYSLRNTRSFLAVGLEGPSEGADLYARAGSFPYDKKRASPSLEAYTKAKLQPPSWWTGLGHDAGALAWQAVRELPPEDTEDDARVRALWVTVRERLASAEAELWTSEARGFAGARALPRTITFVSR